MEHLIDLVCIGLSIVDDTESISRLIAISIAPPPQSVSSTERKDYTLTISNTPSRPISRFISLCESQRPRYGLNYDVLDELCSSPEQNNKRADIEKEDTPKKQSGLRIALVSDEDVRVKTDDETRAINIEDENQRLERGRKNNNLLDDSIYERLEKFHAEIKSLRNLTRVVRTQYRKAGLNQQKSIIDKQSLNEWNSTASFYPSTASLKLPDSFSTENALSNTLSNTSLRQVAESVQPSNYPERVTQRTKPDSRLQLLQPHLRQVEARDDLLKQYNSRLLLRYVQRTLQTSRQLQSIVEHSEDQQESRGGIVSEGAIIGR